MFPKFSKPQNLSLPSSRIGPAFARSLSSGLNRGACGSFLDGEEPESEVGPPAPDRILEKKCDMSEISGFEVGPEP